MVVHGNLYFKKFIWNDIMFNSIANKYDKIDD